MCDKWTWDRLGWPSCWTWMCFALAAPVAISLAFAASQPITSPSPQREPPGKLAAAAITELLSGRIDGEAFTHMMGQRHKEREAGGVSMQDSYPAWLATELVRRAAAGYLFVRDGEKRVALRVTWDMGDTAFWYIARVSFIKSEGTKIVAGGPWLLWESLGSLVTPNGPDDKPWVAEYALSSGAEGDVVELDIFRLPRKRPDSPRSVDPSTAIGKESAQLLLRLQLPVIVSKEPGRK